MWNIGTSEAEDNSGINSSARTRVLPSQKASCARVPKSKTREANELVACWHTADRTKVRLVMLAVAYHFLTSQAFTNPMSKLRVCVA